MKLKMNRVSRIDLQKVYNLLENDEKRAWGTAAGYGGDKPYEGLYKILNRNLDSPAYPRIKGALVKALGKSRAETLLAQVNPDLIITELDELIERKEEIVKAMLTEENDEVLSEVRAAIEFMLEGVTNQQNRRRIQRELEEGFKSSPMFTKK